MVSRIAGERFIVAATLDPVETEEEFERIPPHMSIARWFKSSKAGLMLLSDTLTQLFDDQAVYQHLVGGEAKQYGELGEFPVREIIGAEIEPWAELHKLINGFDGFRADDIYAHHFAAHVTDSPTRTVTKGEKLAIPTVALIRAHSKESLQRVVKSYKLKSDS